MVNAAVLFLLGVLFWNCGAFAQSVSFDCKIGTHDTIVYSESELPADFISTCRGIRSAVDFFESIGYVGRTFKVRVRLQDKVFVKGYDKRAQKETKARFQVFGYHNGKINESFITNFGAPYLKGRKAWAREKGQMNEGLDIDRDFWVSSITHEVSHGIINQIWRESKRNRTLEKNGMPLGSGAHEYIAYTVHISSLPKTHQDAINQLYEGRWMEIDREGINGILHYDFPHLYGASSHKWFQLEYLHDILAGDLDHDRAFTSGVLKHKSEGEQY